MVKIVILNDIRLTKTKRFKEERPNLSLYPLTAWLSQMEISTASTLFSVNIILRL